MGIWHKYKYSRRKGTKKNLTPKVFIWGFGKIEADFLRFYNIDIIEEGFSRKMTWRRFLILLNNLPQDAAFIRWINNKDNFKFVSIYDDDSASL